MASKPLKYKGLLDARFDEYILKPRGKVRESQAKKVSKPIVRVNPDNMEVVEEYGAVAKTFKDGFMPKVVGKRANEDPWKPYNGFLFFFKKDWEAISKTEKNMNLKNPTTMNGKWVVAYDKDTKELYNKFPNAEVAIDYIGNGNFQNVYKALNKKIPTYLGYIWEYED